MTPVCAIEESRVLAAARIRLNRIPLESFESLGIHLSDQHVGPEKSTGNY